ncbi:MULTISPECIES: hypothetical protein [Empedobacter]|uniref:Lipoprotein n=1 Tax=Empedobacter falsenii TaxID=343874 RepID=A0A376GL16_9FLAO|nr:MULTISPECIES: hypothetical protein [Empedobacter]MBY0066620.1 hypothetical protein [Empedobacter falsenii]MDH0658105.1 hypothetical protein [Empedobacter sp. GD03865]MDH0675554.1 hypothetical protein [Empedobacter sp. GD03861]MDH1603872.1 hypothetical protein [Empedobacter sp. GD03739]STD59216.1 Uncharacterised protein [Empedobacter falsenii]
MRKFILLCFAVMLVQSCVTISTVSNVSTNASRYLSIDGIYKTEGTTYSATKVIRRNNNQIVLDFTQMQGEVYYFLKTNQDIELELDYEVKQKNGLMDFSIVDYTGKELTQIGSASKGKMNKKESIHLESYKSYRINFKGDDFKGKVSVQLNNK